MEKKIDAAERVILDPLLHGFVHALATQRPDAFGHIKSRNLLFIAGSARRRARASIRPFARHDDSRSARPQVSVQGEPVLYEICLRPLFFLDVTGPERARIIAHELWHIGPGFDGQLHPERRHGQRSELQLDEELDRALEGFDPTQTEIWPYLTAPGERRLAAWKVRPPSEFPTGSKDRRHYDEKDLFSSIVVQL